MNPKRFYLIVGLFLFMPQPAHAGGSGCPGSHWDDTQLMCVSDRVSGNCACDPGWNGPATCRCNAFDNQGCCVDPFCDATLCAPDYCGDGMCNNRETCGSCPLDCGPCPVPPPAPPPPPAPGPSQTCGQMGGSACFNYTGCSLLGRSSDCAQCFVCQPCGVLGGNSCDVDIPGQTCRNLGATADCPGACWACTPPPGPPPPPAPAPPPAPPMPPIPPVGPPPPGPPPPAPPAPAPAPPAPGPAPVPPPAPPPLPPPIFCGGGICGKVTQGD